jgi:hypothetical protein
MMWARFHYCTNLVGISFDAYAASRL